MKIIRCATIPDSENYLINNIEVTPEQAQEEFDNALKEGLLIYPLVSNQGVWCATSNVNHGRKLPMGLKKWRA